MKKLPCGLQVFEEIITENYIYVDKTNYLIDLIETGKLYFFSRPRRFGKTLTLDTFETLFQGKKELFKGLYAETWLNRKEFEPNPVIRLDMSRVTTNRGLEVIENSIGWMVSGIAESNNIEVDKTALPGAIFEDLIVKLHNKEGKKVVILIDEYDRPLTEMLSEDKETIKAVKNILRDFYVKIKANEKYIKFVFITGIAKFTKVGIFSTLNNITDISCDKKYGKMCGYTEEEIIRYFPDYLKLTAEEQQITVEELIVRMRNYYNGFSFNGIDKLYNPYSTLLFFREKEFFNYWIESGTSRVIADYLKERHLTVEQFRNMPVSRDFAKTPGEIDNATPESFLYQAGYLTLRPGIDEGYRLDYPNTEVLNSMSELLTKNFLGDSDAEHYKNNLYRQIVNGNKDGFVRILNVLLAHIPYDDYNKAAQRQIENNDYPFTAGEWLYRSSILSFLLGTGVVVDGEVHNNHGRADLVIKFGENVWIIEIKVACKPEDIPKKLEEAKTQIIENQYAKPYPGATCLAIVIDDEKRQIVECEKI